MKNLRVLVSTYKVYSRKHLLCHIYISFQIFLFFFLLALQRGGLIPHAKDKESRLFHRVDYSVVVTMLLGNKSGMVGKSVRSFFFFLNGATRVSLPALTSLVFPARKNAGPRCPHQKMLFCRCSNQHSLLCRAVTARPDGQRRINHTVPQALTLNL